jgi:hypothetical protein
MKQYRLNLGLNARYLGLVSISLALLLSPVTVVRADDDDGKFQVIPGVFDPADTDLVQSTWLSGIGCPTNASTSSNGAKKPDGTFTDTACLTGDPKDKDNEGLLLVKTGPTTNFAAAGARFEGLPKKLTLTELGYDIRKPGANVNDPRGSHCGAGAPRFNITTTAGFFFLGCNSPPPTTDTAGIGWQRLRWGGGTGPNALMAFCASAGGCGSVAAGALGPVTGTLKELEIVFDEGQDPSGGPDQFGAAILDNIDVNGVLVGRGPSKAAH